jgi:phosphopentomutase
VDTDSLYGHRRDTAGYGKALVEIDNWLDRIVKAMRRDDLLIISSDHGNDPTAPGTDHTREYVPFIGYSPAFVEGDKPMDKNKANVGTRDGFVDMAATIADWMNVKWSGLGVSVLEGQGARV